MRIGWVLVLAATSLTGKEYISYLGGKYADSALAVATDAGGNTYVAGASRSPDFPDAPGFTSGNRDTNEIAFVAKFDPDGRLIWRAWIGGPGGDSAARAIAVDTNGSATIAGTTSLPSSFPFTGGTPASGFIARLSPDGTMLVKAVGIAALPEAMAIDSSGAVYVAGSAGTGLETTTGAYQPRIKQGDCSFGRLQKECVDAFVIKLTSDFQVVYATYLGGSDDDMARGIAVDSSGSAWVVGSSASADFPVSTQVPFGGRIVEGPNHFGDGFAARLTPDGRGLQLATYLSGPAADYATGVALDGTGSAWLSGQFASGSVAKVGAEGSTSYFSSIPAGATSIAIHSGRIYVSSGGLLVLDPTGKVIHSRSTIDGALAVDGTGAAHIAGTARRLACVTTPEAIQPAYRGGDSDAFAGRIDADRDGPVTVCVTNAATFRPGLHPQFPAGEVSPGEVVSIFGAFEPDTQVTFDGIRAPILYAGADQINAVVPFEVNAPVTRVRVGDFGPVELPVLEAVPGVFLVLNEDYSVNSESNPARRDARIILYATGAGRMDPPMSDGSVVSPPMPLPRPVLGVGVRFGTVAASIEYAGAAPGMIAGVIQVNAKLPQFSPNSRVMSVPMALLIGPYSNAGPEVWIAPN